MTTENKPEQSKTEEPKVEKVPEKPKEIVPKKRIFVYDGREFQDPDPKMTPDEIRQYYVTFFPELANAEILAPVNRPVKAPEEGVEAVIEFKRRVGTKGKKAAEKTDSVKFDGTCWSCGKKTMVQIPDAGKGWLKCSGCGATDYKPMKKE